MGKMTDSPPRRLSPVFLWGLAAVLAVISIGSLLLFFLRTAEGSWSYLPEKETVALFHTLSPERRTALEQSFPILRAVPPSQAPIDIAILILPDGTLGWASFRKEAPLPASDRDKEGSFTVAASSQPVRSLIKHDAGRLGGNRHFLALTTRLDPTLSFVALDLRLLAPIPTTLDRALLDSLPSPLALAAWDGSGTILRFAGPAGKFGGAAPDLPSLSPTPIVSIASADALMWNNPIVSAIPAEQRTILQGLLSPQLATLLGQDISLPYDLAPLLAAPMTVSWTRTASGALHFLVQGNAPASVLRDKLDMIHRSFRSGLPSFDIAHRTLTNGFAATTIGEDASGVADETRTEGAWTVRKTARQEGGASLISAVAGERFVLGNDDAWIAQALGTPAASPLPRFTATPFFGGATDRDAFLGFFRDLLPSSLVQNILFALGPAGDRLLWSAEQTHGVLTITLQGKTTP